MALLLLIDSDPSRRDMLERRLVQKGYRAQATDGVAEALAMAGAIVPDLVILDVDTAPESAQDFVGQLRCSPRTRTIPLIALCGGQSPVSESCDACEATPVNFQHLLATIDRLLATVPKP